MRAVSATMYAVCCLGEAINCKDKLVNAGGLTSLR